jgi:hypothetical protein
VQPTPKAGNKPWQHCIVHGLDKPGSSATVSINTNFGDYSLFAGFYAGLRGACSVLSSLGSNRRTRQAKLCLVRVPIDPIPPQGCLRLPTCPRQSSSPLVAMTSGNPGHAVVTRPIETSSPSGRCTPWGLSMGGGRALSWSRMHSSSVRHVRRTGTRPCRLWRHRGVRTPTA